MQCQMTTKMMQIISSLINQIYVYITRCVVDSYAREAGRPRCLGAGAAEEGQPLHLVVCKNCMAPAKTFLCKNNGL